MRYETTLVGHVRDHVVLTMTTRYIPWSIEETKARPLHLSVKTFEVKERQIFCSGFEKLKMDMCATFLRSTPKRVSLAISKLSGRANKVFMCNSFVDAAIPAYDSLKDQMSRVFAPPNQAYRVRSRLLAFWQSNNEKSDLVQEMRTFLAAMS